MVGVVVVVRVVMVVVVVAAAAAAAMVRRRRRWWWRWLVAVVALPCRLIFEAVKARWWYEERIGFHGGHIKATISMPFH